MPGRSKFDRRRFLTTTGLASAGLFLTGDALAQCEITTPDILGPFHVPDAPFRTVLASADEPGTRLFIDGQVFRNDCELPLAGAVVDVWHATESGCYFLALVACGAIHPDGGEGSTEAGGKLFLEAPCAVEACQGAGKVWVEIDGGVLLSGAGDGLDGRQVCAIFDQA